MILGFYFSTIHAERLEEEAAARVFAGKTTGPIPSLPLFHRVSDSLYRGAQPSLAGMNILKNMGIKTIINLRHYHSDRYMTEDLGLNYEHVDIKSYSVRAEHVIQFLYVLLQRDSLPAFVHCSDGVGRTGFVCAMYRILVSGWTREAATQEMQDLGLDDPETLAKLKRRIAEMDLEFIRKEAGLTPGKGRVP